MDKTEIDPEVIGIVAKLLDYEFKVRLLTDPIDADNKVAKLEESVRRNLKVRGPLTQRELRRWTHGDRDGIWAFDAAVTNLMRVGDICFVNGRYEGIPDEVSPNLSPEETIRETA
jgi:hypothetical protein